MTWEQKETEKPTETAAPAEVKPAEPEKPAELTEPKEDPKPAEEPPAGDPPAAEAMVPQKLLGQVAKKIREKAKAEMSDASTRIKQLEEENQRLRAGEIPEVDPVAAEEDAKISQKVREEFLRRQDAYGRKKYGDQAYADALLLVQSQGDAHLIGKIQGAASPADALIEEATRIAEEIELGPTPQKRNEALKAKIRKEVEAEMADKFKAIKNQPTDVSGVRTAGGHEKAKVSDNWGTVLPR